MALPDNWPVNKLTNYRDASWLRFSIKRSNSESTFGALSCLFSSDRFPATPGSDPLFTLNLMSSAPNCSDAHQASGPKQVLVGNVAILEPGEIIPCNGAFLFTMSNTTS